MTSCLLFLLCILNTGFNNHAIERVTTDYSYYDMTLEQVIHVQEIEIKNSSSQDFYTWILDDDFEQITGTVSDDRIINWYFNRLVGDFSFLALMTDNVYYPNGFIPVIGACFLKRISPGESFKYSILFDGQPDISVDQRVVCYSIIDLERKGIPTDDFYLFKGESLTILRSALKGHSRRSR